MAQIDTGLGWSAKSEWLITQPGQICSITIIGGPDFPNQPIKKINAPSDTDFFNGGLKVAHNNGYNADFYILSDSYDDELAGWYWNGSRYVLAVQRFGNVNCSVSGIWLYQNGTRCRAPYGGGGRDSYYSSEDMSFLSANIMRDLNPDIRYGTEFSSAQAMRQAAIKTTTTFSKDSAGYSVACIAKWKTDNNVLFTTPVLISSETENTDMTCSDPTYNLAKLNIRNDGIQFYMSFFDVVDQNIQSQLEVRDLSVFKLDLDQVFRLIADPTGANIQVTETVDPFKDFPYNGEDAGEINPDPQDDDIDIDELPTKSFASAGFCRIYNPDESDLNDLANYMWTDQNFLQTVINHLKQILENPIEAIISLSMVPVQPPVGPSKVPVNVMFISTGVSMRPVTSQFVSIDCGTTVLQEVYGGALDYNPYTRVQIYLPYIGTVQLDTDEVMAKTLQLTYHIDVVTGICCAEIKADSKLLYQFSGHCSVSQPITSADFSSYLNAAIAAAKVAVGVATGSAEVTAAAAAAQAPPEVASSSPASQSMALVPASGGGPIGPHLGSPGSHSAHNWTDFSDIASPQSGSGAAWGELAKPGNMNTVASAMGGKMVVQHSGGFSGNSGYLAKRRPYLIIVRPRIANPENYAQHFGRTSMEYLNLGSCTGYTKVQSVHLSGFDATNPELSEISSLLKGGVLF